MTKTIERKKKEKEREGKNKERKNKGKEEGREGESKEKKETRVLLSMVKYICKTIYIASYSEPTQNKQQDGSGVGSPSVYVLHLMVWEGLLYIWFFLDK